MRMEPASTRRRLHRPLEQVTNRFRSIRMLNPWLRYEPGAAAPEGGDWLQDALRTPAPKMLQCDPDFRHLEFKDLFTAGKTLAPVGQRVAQGLSCSLLERRLV